jgi:hypothetical protein
MNNLKELNPISDGLQASSEDPQASSIVAMRPAPAGGASRLRLEGLEWLLIEGPHPLRPEERYRHRVDARRLQFRTALML